MNHESIHSGSLDKSLQFTRSHAYGFTAALPGIEHGITRGETMTGDYHFIGCIDDLVVSVKEPLSIIPTASDERDGYEVHVRGCVAQINVDAVPARVHQAAGKHESLVAVIEHGGRDDISGCASNDKCTKAFWRLV